MIDIARFNDVLMRHQIYVEGVKQGFSAKFSEHLVELRKELLLVFAELEFKTMDGFTKARLNKFLRSIREIQNKVFGKSATQLANDLETFMRAEATVSEQLFGKLYFETQGEAERNDFKKAVKRAEESDEGNAIYPLLWFSNGKLWTAIQNAPLPAVGVTSAVFAKAFFNTSKSSVENTIVKAWANKQDVRELLFDLAGTTNKSSVLNKVLFNFGGVSATILQHISANVQNAIASFLWSHYRWVSIIDNATTQICRDRNNRIYEYGSGPVPPAHIRCRSKTVPASANDTAPAETYFAWLARQPKQVLRDILGNEKADALLSGKLRAAQFPQFSEFNPITIEQFIKKLSLIVL